jgi:hypothetical protein
VRVDDSLNFGKLMVTKAVIKRKFLRIEPKLRGRILLRNMDMWRLITICHVKEESITLRAQNRRDMASVMQESLRFNRRVL